MNAWTHSHVPKLKKIKYRAREGGAITALQLVFNYNEIAGGPCVWDSGADGNHVSNWQTYTLPTNRGKHTGFKIKVIEEEGVAAIHKLECKFAGGNNSEVFCGTGPHQNQGHNIDWAEEHYLVGMYCDKMTLEGKKVLAKVGFITARVLP